MKSAAMMSAIFSGLMFFAPTSFPKPPVGGVRITVRFLNLSEAPASVIRPALASATRMLSDADVQLTWVDCEQAGDQNTRSACGVPPQLDEVMLQIVPEPAPGFAGTTVGVAFVDPNASMNATVFYRRVETRAQDGHLATAPLLGAAIAHELGHLLIGDSHHGRSGLMRANWDRTYLHLAAIEILGFTRQEKQRMRGEISRRRIALASN